jgi:diaminopimelate decarboxylase
LARGVPTPFFVFSAGPVRAALKELAVLEEGLPVPVRHWLSCKTQPVPPLLRWWRRQGKPIEVVSEFEFLAARVARYPAADILVNGPAKDRWLEPHRVRGLRVNFDSVRELDRLLPFARALDWSVGVRFLTVGENDPDCPTHPTQFGMERKEVVSALGRLRRAGVQCETAHFHLRTNVRSPATYEQAIREIAGICRMAGFTPVHLDCGGGVPPPHVRTRSGAAVDRDFSLREFARVLRRAVPLFPGLREVWLENGRFLTARSGGLVVRVLEVKERRGLRQLICDGGRTLNALISKWEDHALLPLSPGAGPSVMTAVYGPTCMAFDQLGLRPLPATLRVGDHLIWLEAGAYCLPWETRFSHGPAAVFWHAKDHLELVRPPGSFKVWWAEWRSRRAPDSRRPPSS